MVLEQETRPSPKLNEDIRIVNIGSRKSTGEGSEKKPYELVLEDQDNNHNAASIFYTYLSQRQSESFHFKVKGNTFYIEINIKEKSGTATTVGEFNPKILAEIQSALAKFTKEEIGTAGATTRRFRVGEFRKRT